MKILHNLHLKFLHILCFCISVEILIKAKEKHGLDSICSASQIFIPQNQHIEEPLKTVIISVSLFLSLLNQFPMLNSLASFKSQCHLGVVRLTILFNDPRLFPLHPNLIFFKIFLQIALTHQVIQLFYLLLIFSLLFYSLMNLEQYLTLYYQ